MVKIVCELGINCNGDINVAKSLINKASLSGCHYVKFQKRDINLVYSKQELDKYRESPWGNTVRDQKTKLEFDQYQYRIIDEHCHLNNIEWFASPWDVNSVDFLMQFKIPYIKIASALITDLELLSKVKYTNLPVIISTGMSTKQEVSNCVNFLGDQLEYILACTSTYPTPLNEVNLSFISTLKKEFPNKKIGFSNHHPGILFAAVSVAMGAEMIEFHATLDRSMYGTDQSASIEPPGISKLCDYVRDLSVAIGDGKWTVFPGEQIVKAKLRK